MTSVYDPEAVGAEYSMTAGRPTPPEMEWMMKVDPKKVHAWMSQKGFGDINCSCCGETRWIVGENFVEARLSTDSNHIESYISLTCMTCANTKFFNTYFMGNVLTDY